MGKRPPPSELIYDPENPLAAADMGKLRNERQFLCKITMADKRSKSDLIKAVRRYVGPDHNGIRLLQIHPRCEHVIDQMLDYHTPKEGRASRGGDPKPDPNQEDHAVDCIQYLMTGRLTVLQ